MTRPHPVPTSHKRFYSLIFILICYLCASTLVFCRGAKKMAFAMITHLLVVHQKYVHERGPFHHTIRAPIVACAMPAMLLVPGLRYIRLRLFFCLSGWGASRGKQNSWAMCTVRMSLSHSVGVFLQAITSKHCYKYSFFPRTIIDWNSLPDKIATIKEPRNLN